MVVPSVGFGIGVLLPPVRTGPVGVLKSGSTWGGGEGRLESSSELSDVSSADGPARGGSIGSSSRVSSLVSSLESIALRPLPCTGVKFPSDSSGGCGSRLSLAATPDTGGARPPEATAASRGSRATVPGRCKGTVGATSTDMLGSRLPLIAIL